MHFVSIMDIWIVLLSVYLVIVTNNALSIESQFEYEAISRYLISLQSLHEENRQFNWLWGKAERSEVTQAIA